MSVPPAERLEDIKDQVHEVASMIELIARLVLADDKLRGQS